MRTHDISCVRMIISCICTKFSDSLNWLFKPYLLALLAKKKSELMINIMDLIIGKSLSTKWGVYNKESNLIFKDSLKLFPFRKLNVFFIRNVIDF